MKQKIVVIILSWMLVLLTMVIIFNFSDENPKQSTETSKGMVEDILDIFLPEEEITPQLVAKVQIPVRKLAHFAIYMLLGFCLANAFRATLRIKLIFNYIFSMITAVIYAGLDEFHQSFTNRAASIKDVLIDSGGALFGILLFALFYYIVLRIQRKNPS